METLEALVTSALIVAIQLGVPVAVLFIIGYLACRAKRRGTGGQEGAPGGSGSRARQQAGLHCASTRCPSDGEGSYPARADQALPCWQAMKLSLGRLRSE